MGEYAKYNGQTVKIGTCEDMLYLRYDQRHLVTKEPGSLDPSDESIIGEIRFRFPFPQEDDIQPGGFDDPFYGLGVYGADELLANVDHGSVQFCSNHPRSGLVVSLPCPEGEAGKALPFKIHKNGYSGSVLISQQRRIGDELWTVCECGSCGSKFRLPVEEAEKLAVVLRSMADKDKEDARSKFYHTIADRIMAGYNVAELQTA